MPSKSEIDENREKIENWEDDNQKAVGNVMLLLGFCLYPINPGRLSNQCCTGADRYTPTLPR